MDQQQDPDEFSADFQLQLANNFKELDRIRIELIDIQSRLPEQKTEAAASSKNSLFAELDSVSFGQLFRIGAALLMPLMLSASLWSMTQLWLYPLLALEDSLSPAAAIRAAFLSALRELWRSLIGLVVLTIPLVIFLLYGKLFVQLLPLWILLGASLPSRLTLLLTEPILRP